MTKKRQFKRKAALALPSVSIKGIKEGESLYFKPINEMTSREQIDNKTGEVKMEGGKPVMITTMPVVLLETGEEGEMVVPFVMKQALERAGDYIGRSYEAVKGPKRNRTVEWAVYEIEEGGK